MVSSWSILYFDFHNIAGLWLAGEVVNHVGSKADEGRSAFQRRSCFYLEFLSLGYKITLRVAGGTFVDGCLHLVDLIQTQNQFNSYYLLVHLFPKVACNCVSHRNTLTFFYYDTFGNLIKKAHSLLLYGIISRYINPSVRNDSLSSTRTNFHCCEMSMSRKTIKCASIINRFWKHFRS